MQINIDQEAYDNATEFETLPEGDYTIVLFSVDEGSGPKGQYLNWECNVIDPAYEGQKLWMITSLAPKAVWRVKKLCEAVGVEPQGGQLHVTAMLGKYLRCSVYHDEYKKQIRAKIDTFWPVDEDFQPTDSPLVYNLPEEDVPEDLEQNEGPPEEISDVNAELTEASCDAECATEEDEPVPF